MIRARPKLTALVCAVALTAGCSGGGERRRVNKPDDRTRPSVPPASSVPPIAVPPIAVPPIAVPPIAVPPIAVEVGPQPPPVPASGAYLGAWINPTGPERDHAFAANRPRDQVAAMQANFPSLGLLHLYKRWDAPAPVAEMQSIADTGAVPVVSWGCGPDQAIIDGLEDDHIRSYAETLRAFGRPVFLRYAWEMNLEGPQRASCASADGPAGFVAAWRRMREIFREMGADNVAFVWCPGIARPDNWRSYFPGADVVDWIGIDGYVRDPDPAAAATAFPRLFGPFYAQFVDEGKPFMVGETGALPGAQAEYLSSLAALLPSAYPRVKALAYFDAPGPRGEWSLDELGQRAFSSLAADPYFSFRA